MSSDLLISSSHPSFSRHWSALWTFWSRVRAEPTSLEKQGGMEPVLRLIALLSEAAHVAPLKHISVTPGDRMNSGKETWTKCETLIVSPLSRSSARESVQLTGTSAVHSTREELLLRGCAANCLSRTWQFLSIEVLTEAPTESCWSRLKCCCPHLSVPPFCWSLLLSNRGNTRQCAAAL